MLPMFPMLIPEIPSIDTSKNEAGDNDVDRETAPKVCVHEKLARTARRNFTYSSSL